MFTDLYLQTSDPKLSFSALFSPSIFTKIILSVVFHTIIYAAFCNMVSYIFFGKILSNSVNIRLVTCLVFIMFFGFFARFTHVKEIYKSYNYNLEKTRAHLDRLYIGWIFIS
uniref:Uncharacterized protein n=1 Tax=viral metagenome TaxID=1070528 RepID=A0A6C0HCW5_9ZZZZ